MDWQQIASLVIVASTALLFVGARLLTRRPKWYKANHCGCIHKTHGGGQPGRIVVRSRRGDTRQTIIHSA